MNEFLRKFDTIRFIAPWNIFRNFLGIFHFLNSNLNFEFGPVSYRTKPELVWTDLTGQTGPVTDGLVNFGRRLCLCMVCAALLTLLFFSVSLGNTIHTTRISSGWLIRKGSVAEGICGAGCECSPRVVCPSRIATKKKKNPAGGRAAGVGWSLAGFAWTAGPGSCLLSQCTQISVLFLLKNWWFSYLIVLTYWGCIVCHPV